MDGSSAIAGRRLRQPAGLAIIEVLIDAAVAGRRALSRGMSGLARVRRNALLRRELHGMSDHMLRDIGVDRAHIDSLFR